MISMLVFWSEQNFSAGTGHKTVVSALKVYCNVVQIELAGPNVLISVLFGIKLSPGTFVQVLSLSTAPCKSDRLLLSHILNFNHNICISDTYTN